jgi:gas vesicle protein
MKKILLAVAGGLMIGAIAASHAKLPAAPPKSDAQKAAEADKAAAAKAKEGADLDKARDRAVMNYKKNKGIAMNPPAKAAPAKAAKKK